MIEDNRYCVDIIHQCNSVSAALTEVKKNILRKHLNHCVMDSFRSGNPEDAQEKVEEIVAIMGYMSK
jgi:DNA-binding FrmR family transcriptional regulator